MGSFTVLGDVLLRIIVLSPAILFLMLFLKNNRNKSESSIYLILFLLAGSVAAYYFIRVYEVKKQEAHKYTGIYDLHMLDCDVCDSCYLNLRDDYTYDIMQRTDCIGKGTWDLEMNSETGYYLKIDHGPNQMILPHMRTIGIINRKPCSYKGYTH